MKYMEVKKITKEDYDKITEEFKVVEGDIQDLASKDPAMFCYYYLGIRPYAWQKEVMNSVRAGNRKTIICCARQMGKTMMTAMLILWALVFNKGNAGIYKNTKIGIISRSDNQAIKIMNDLRKIMRIGDSHLSEVRGPEYKNYFHNMVNWKKSADNNKRMMTILPRGEAKVDSFVKSFPPTDSILGESLDLVFIDEASRIDEIEPDIYDRAIVPTAVKNPNAMFFVTSTPRGQSGFFYELFDPFEKYPEHEYVRFWYDIDSIEYDDIRQYKSALANYEELKKKGNEVVARQEYYAEFVVNETSFFNPRDVDAMFNEKEIMLFTYPTDCDMGIDFGGKGTSHTVITISTQDQEGQIHRLFHKRYDVGADGMIIEDVASLLQDFNIVNINCDDCPAAQYIMNKMEDRGWKLTKMNFAGEKVKKYGSFRENLHKGKISSYPDKNLEEEMRAMIQKQATGTRTKIEAPKGYTDDLIDSFMLSAYYYIDDIQPLTFLDIDDYDENKRIH